MQCSPVQLAAFVTLLQAGRPHSDPLAQMRI